MLAHVLIQAWTKPRVARPRGSDGADVRVRKNLRTRHVRIWSAAAHFALPAQHRVYSNPEGPLSAVQGYGNRARSANQTFEELGLRRLASMSFRRRSVWIAWLLPEPKVLELPEHSAFNQT